MSALSPNDPLRLVLTTEGDRASAERLAHLLIDRRLAACVTLVDVTSVYRWDDAVVDATEVQLVVKTTVDGVRAVTAAIGDAHTYDLPEVVVLDVEASAAYAAWVDGEVREPPVG